MFGGVREVPRAESGRSRPGLLRFARNDKLRGPMAETVLNLRGLRCPLPALKTRKALKGLAAGDRLVVECTDPLSTIDIPNLLRETGDVLEGDAREQDVFVFRIRKSE
jgi:tRNA 2-thiouridine synthesizing protein A